MINESVVKINGKTYHGKSIIIDKDKIIIDGETSYLDKKNSIEKLKKENSELKQKLKIALKTIDKN